MNLFSTYRAGQTVFGYAEKDYAREEEPQLLPSVLHGVSDDAWTDFCCQMIVAECGHVGENNSLGLFQMTPRRLADLGLTKKLARSKNGTRTVWVAMFVEPLTSELFLNAPPVQYAAFCRSVRDYDVRMRSKELDRGKISRAGAHAILHRAGPSGLKSWAEGERFSGTVALHDAVAGLF